MIVPKTQQKVARKRIKLKRYLALMGVKCDHDMPTEVLQAFVRALHKERSKDARLPHAWPMCKSQVLELASQNKYVNQLISNRLKLNRFYGFYVREIQPERYCDSIDDLIKAGVAEQRFLKIEANMHVMYANQ